MLADAVLSNDLILKLVQTGLTGFAVILAILGFRLLRKEQEKSRPNSQMLGVIVFLLIAQPVLVVVANFITPPPWAPYEQQLSDCHSSILTLDTMLKQTAASDEGIRNQGRKAVEQCKRPVESLLQ